MKALVTGSRGFLGRFLCDALRQKGFEICEVHSQNCDLTKEDSLHLFADTKFDEIYHLAAWTQAGTFCLHHPSEQWIINQKINTHIVDFWIKKQPQAFFYAMGTSCGYDPAFHHSEENYLKGMPIDSLFAYGMTKRMLLVGLDAAHRQYGLNFLYLIPSTLYGPNYHVDHRQLHFIFDLIVKILKAKYLETPAVLWGDGEQTRELIHVADFLQALFAVKQAGVKNTLINIGSGVEYSIKQFAKEISQIVDYPFEKITYDLSKHVGARKKFLDIAKLQTHLPQFQSRSLQEGLTETVTWANQNLIDLLRN